MTRGEAFYKKVDKALDLAEADEVWLALLQEVVRSMDLIERLEANVADRELTTSGSRGQVTASPLLAELRHQKAALARLLSQLGTDDGETQSQRQRRIAQKRWK
jgi:hypothetical protein